MGLGSRIINRLIGPNLLIVAFVCVLMSALPLPSWLQSFNEQVDRLLLSAAIDFVDLPSPQTPITVIHVPDVEYEAWLSDIAGADALLTLIENSAATSSRPITPLAMGISRSPASDRAPTLVSTNSVDLATAWSSDSLISGLNPPIKSI